MVDSTVSFFLKNLSQLLVSEARLFFGVKDRVSSLQNKLQLIDAFLKDNDGKKSKKEMEKVVGKQIREAAEEAEDVIDTFVTNMTMHNRRSKLDKMIHCVHHAKLLWDVAQKIKNINAKTTEILANKNEFNSFQQEGESSSTREVEEKMVERLHERRRKVEENDVVGFEHDSNEIIKLLKNEGSRSNVVTIVGMGGLGKTTLARKVYNNHKVKKYFDCCAWVYVSNDCRVKDLFLGLLQCLKPNLEREYVWSKKKGKKKKGIEKSQDLSTLTVQDLKQMVHKCLERKKYLLVLDDLWEKDDWDDVQDAFPSDNISSKILITSRSKEVASHTSKDPPYFLKFLNEEESWELFSKRVFCTKECPSDLEPLGRQIVKSCQGLPLSIIVLAGLLANKKKSNKEWSKVVGHVNWYLTQDRTQVKDIILKLSYDNLPKRLQPCFLYFGIFPEDFEIPVKGLLHQWVAEGFIQEIGTRSAEDVAEDYLYELIDRSLVQAARVKLGSGGGVKTCRIHDLLRDLCISENKEDKFFEVCTDNNIHGKIKPRRLSIHCGISRYVSSSINDHSCVRSLFYFGPRYSLDSTEQKRLFKSFKLLRVLDPGQIQCERMLSYNVGLFIHLRYLRICSSSSLGIPVPDSICTLQSLQTLDFSFVYGGLISFPGRLWKLRQLRHLYTVFPIELRDYHHSEADDKVMWNLQTISSIVLNRQSTYLFEKVRFPKLQKLGLEIKSPLHKGEKQELLSSLQHLSHLNKLHVTLDSLQTRCSSDMDTIHQLFQSMQQLAHSSTLTINFANEFLTREIAFPLSLNKLTVNGITCMNDEIMKTLGNLTNLRILILKSHVWHDVFEISCIAGGFPQLQVFKMKQMNVGSWKLTNGAMPCLQSLVIDTCTRLNSLPNELWSSIALTQVRVCNPSNALSHTLRNLEMKNGCELTIEYY